METLKVGIIIGSTRPGRKGEAVAHWAFDHATKRGDAEFSLIDIADFGLPLLDEPVPPSLGQYSKDHTMRWAEAIAPIDAFIFVTPEYNHGISGALKNAIDFLFAEWNDKAAGFVGYGSAYGARAVEQLRLVMGEIKIADVRQQVLLSLHTDWENYSEFKPAERHVKSLNMMIDELIAWGTALKDLRAKRQEHRSSGSAA